MAVVTKVILYTQKVQLATRTKTKGSERNECRRGGYYVQEIEGGELNARHSTPLVRVSPSPPPSPPRRDPQPVCGVDKEMLRQNATLKLYLYHLFTRLLAAPFLHCYCLSFRLRQELQPFALPCLLTFTLSSLLGRQFLRHDHCVLAFISSLLFPRPSLPCLCHYTPLA